MNPYCIDTDTEAAPAENSASDDNDTLPIIYAGIVVVVIFIGFTLLAIIVFVLWWKGQKRKIKQAPSISAYNAEALVRTSTLMRLYYLFCVVQ